MTILHPHPDTFLSWWVSTTNHFVWMNDRHLIAQMVSPAPVTINNLKGTERWQSDSRSCPGCKMLSVMKCMFQKKKKDNVESDAGHMNGDRHTFHDEIEELWPWVAFALDGACVLAVVAYIHFLYLKAVLMLIPDAGHNGHAWVHGPFVVPRKNDAWAIQPGAFRDSIQQVAPVAATQKDGRVRCEENPLTMFAFEYSDPKSDWCLNSSGSDNRKHSVEHLTLQTLRYLCSVGLTRNMDV